MSYRWRAEESDRERTRLTQRALRALAPSLRQLAEEAGLSYATLKAWSAGVRTPSSENLGEIADALDRRGEHLKVLAKEVRREAGRGGKG